MKIQSRKITIGLLVLAFMVMIVASVQIASAPNTDIEGIVTGIEEDLTDHEEMAEEEATEEEIAEEEIEKEEKYLREKVQEDALSATSDDSEAEKSIVTGGNENNNIEPTIDMSPITGERYTVKNGDTLFLIAQRANTTINELISMNSLKNDMIQVGQVIQTKGAPQASNIASSNTNHSISRGGQRDDDIYWLSRIIHAEAQGESYQGKVAVGNVILNRVRSGNFPNSIYGVVFDKQHGYTQFSPVIDGTIYNTPGKDSVQAATEVLNGARPVGEALYFLNPRKATNFWIVANRKYMQTIGEHDFYY